VRLCPAGCPTAVTAKTESCHSAGGEDLCCSASALALHPPIALGYWLVAEDQMRILGILVLASFWLAVPATAPNKA
jgi:hypothetical protein